MNEELKEQIRQLLRDELVVEVVLKPTMYGEKANQVIRLKLGDEVISTDWLD